MRVAPDLPHDAPEGDSLNNRVLIAKISKDTGSSKSGAAAAVESLIDGITKSLKKGDAVAFVGFGIFKTLNGKRARCATRRQTHPSRFQSGVSFALQQARR